MSKERKRRRTPEEIRTVLRKFRASSLSLAGFCRREHVALSSMQYWRRKFPLGNASPVLRRVAEIPRGDSRLEITNGSGYSVRVPVGHPGDDLARVLRVLESVCSD